MTRIGGVTLEQLKAQLNDKVDTEAAQLRMRFITLHEGMDLVYGEKRREAEALMVNLDLSEGETPHLTLEAARFNITRFELATTIIMSAYEWTNISAMIEERRTWHKDQISKSPTPSQAREAAVVDWSTVTSYL